METNTNMNTIQELIDWLKKETQLNPDNRMIDTVKLLDEFISPRIEAENKRLRKITAEIFQNL